MKAIEWVHWKDLFLLQCHLNPFKENATPTKLSMQATHVYNQIEYLNRVSKNWDQNIKKQNLKTNKWNLDRYKDKYINIWDHFYHMVFSDWSLLSGGKRIVNLDAFPKIPTVSTFPFAFDKRLKLMLEVDI